MCMRVLFLITRNLSALFFYIIAVSSYIRKMYGNQSCTHLALKERSSDTIYKFLFCFLNRTYCVDSSEQKTVSGQLY